MPDAAPPLLALHLVAAQLRPDATDAAIAHAVERARALADAPGVLTVLLGLSEAQLVVATWLDDRGALDAFAASQSHMAFVMQGLAPAIREMWSAAVETTTAPPTTTPAALWLFAVPAAEGVYEWQVRDLLQDVSALPGELAAGATFEERERFRAAGVLLLAADEAPSTLEALLTPLRTTWAESFGTIREALTPGLPA